MEPARPRVPARRAPELGHPARGWPGPGPGPGRSRRRRDGTRRILRGREALRDGGCVPRVPDFCVSAVGVLAAGSSSPPGRGCGGVTGGSLRPPVPPLGACQGASGGSHVRLLSGRHVRVAGRLRAGRRGGGHGARVAARIRRRRSREGGCRGGRAQIVDREAAHARGVQRRRELRFALAVERGGRRGGGGG